MSQLNNISFRQLLFEAFEAVKFHKIFWLLGMISVLTSESRSGKEVLHRILYWNGSPFSFLSSLRLSDTPSEKLSEWLGGAGFVPAIAISIMVIAWLLQLILQAGIIQAAVVVRQKNALAITRIIRFSVMNGWRIILLNLVLFGGFYVIYLLLGFIFSHLSFLSFEARGEFERQYRSSHYQVLGVLLWWLLVPLNFVITLVVYPFAKRSVVLNKGNLRSALYYTVFIIRYNLFELGKLFFIGTVLGLGLAGTLEGLTNIVPALKVLWPEQIRYLGTIVTQVSENEVFLGVMRGLSILVGGYLAAIVSVFGTYVYLECEKRYLDRVIVVPIMALLH